MFVRQLAVIGAGYVGLTTAACLASLGHHVVCVDIDAAKVARLRAGDVPILEPGLAELVAEGLAAGRLGFDLDAAAVVRSSGRDGRPIDVVVLCLPTPMAGGGAADLSAVEQVARELGELLPAGCVLVNKSTVPVGTAARIRHLVGRGDVAVASNPEFLREGSAVADFLHPDRIVVGSDSPEAAERVAALYSRLGAPTLLTDAASAELVKYAANCFLAVKLSYVNALAELCEHLGADVGDVTEGMGHDRRIGQAFLRPGPGWGGSCLPKDTQALLRSCEATGYDFPLLSAAVRTNGRTRTRMVDKIRSAAGGELTGRRVCLLGLTFKAGTDDLRDSPALAVAEALLAEGAELTAHDPGCLDPVLGFTDGIQLCDNPVVAAKDADVIAVLTEWPRFRHLDWAAMARAAQGRTVVDTRNLLDPDVVRRSGLSWVGVGRR